MATIDDAWLETCKVAIAAQSGSDVQFNSITDTVDISPGDKDIEGIPTLSGGRIVKFTPQGDAEITLEAYPRDAGTDSGTTGKGFFDLLHAADASQPVVIPNTRARSKYRIAVMWTDASVNAEAQVVAPTNEALRVVMADGYFTSVKPSFTDGVLKFTITFKTPAFDKSASANVKVESVTGSATATLTALASYTSTVKW